jgi:Mg2+/Co2+ transporter CorB
VRGVSWTAFGWDDWSALIALLVLLIAIALLNAAESAIGAASRARLQALERKGSERAALVLRLKTKTDALGTAVRFGNIAAVVLATALVACAFTYDFGFMGPIYAAILVAGLFAVFGEALARIWALNSADRAALSLVPIARFWLGFLTPPARLARGVALGILRGFGWKPNERPAEAAAEELKGAIEQHGAASPDSETRKERQMLRSILDLADVTVASILVHRRQVVAIDADQPAEAILEQALSSPHTRIPLWRGQSDNVVGVLHAKALLQAVRANGGNAATLDIAAIAARPWFIPDATTLLEQLEAFRKRREHFALVVDEYGGLQGVVTLEDILEEIVGDIAERHEFSVPGVRPQSDGTYVIDGHVTIRDLNRQFDWRLPDESAATIAGLVLYEARRIPEVGQVFVFHGLRFEIVRRKRHQIATLRVGVAVDTAAPKTKQIPAGGERAA